MTPTPIAATQSYHAHINFTDAEARARAAFVRQQIFERFPVQLGCWHDRLIGPHALPMYQVAFAVPQFATFVPWLMLNRQDLPVLVHPNTGNARRDHITNAIWLGEKLPILHIEDLPETTEDGFFNEVIVNTEPSLTP